MTFFHLYRYRLKFLQLLALNMAKMNPKCKGFLDDWTFLETLTQHCSLHAINDQEDCRSEVHKGCECIVKTLTLNSI